MTDDTATKQPTNPIPGNKPFKKGDARINRLGRPKNFDQVRKLAQAIAAESISDEEKMTRIEALLRVMSSSRNPKDRELFLSYAFGKPKEQVDTTLDGKVIFEVIRREVPDNVTNPTSEASPIPEQSGQTESDSGRQTRRKNNGRGNVGGG